MQRCLLIDEPQLPQPVRADSSQLECSKKLAAPHTRIFQPRGVVLDSGRAIGDMDENRVPQLWDQAARPDRFVVRMRDDDRGGLADQWVLKWHNGASSGHRIARTPPGVAGDWCDGGARRRSSGVKQ